MERTQRGLDWSHFNWNFRHKYLHSLQRLFTVRIFCNNSEIQLDYMQIEGEGEGDDGSQQPSCSDPGHILAFRKILEEELEPMVSRIVRRLVKPMVITTVKQEIVPAAEDIFRRVVKEEIQPLNEKLSAGGIRNDFSKERTLQLKFSDEVSDTVQTSTRLKSKNNEYLKLSLVDSTGKTVDRGTGSSAKVEIALRKENDNNDDSESETIATEDKENPRFAKSFYKLKDGVVSLSDLKLGHGKEWTKLCKCKLRAWIAQNLDGITVQEAWTEPFLVVDKRIKHYTKHPQPSLLSEVWRLKNIGRNGEPFRRLDKKKIKNLRDFLFWLSVNPEELQKQILRVGNGKWETITAHARTCDISNDKRLYSHTSSDELPQMRVVYDVVGELKGVIDESHFVGIDNLSADKKDEAHKLLRSLLEPPAFVQRYETFFVDGASLLQQFPLPDLQNSGVAAFVDPGPCFDNHRLPTSLLSEKHMTTAGASENEIGESSSRWSRTNMVEENGARDPGTSISGAHEPMETMFDAASSWPDQRWQSSPDLFENIEAWEQQFIVEPRVVVSTSYVPKGWKFVVGVLKWWLSSRRVTQGTRKRKR